MRNDVDLLVVGAGPAGAATALFAGAMEPRLVERTLVIDRARFPRDKVCAGAIGGRADRALAAIGVRVDVPAVQVRGVSVQAGTGRMCEHMPFAVGRVVRRLQFDAALVDAVRARGVAVREGVALRSLRRRHDHVEIETSAGTLRAAAVVGADGVGSAVRRAMGVPKGDFHAQAVEVDTEPADGDPPRDVIHFDVSDRGYTGYAWDFPTTVDGRTLVCRGVYRLTRGAGTGAGADVDALLRGRLAERGIDPARVRFRRFAERGLGLYQPLSADRVLLVGEAAGIDPLLGEGIAQAILHGQTAGAYLARCWRTDRWRFADYRRHVRAARVGLDLRVRAAATPLAYGPLRPFVERWVTGSRGLARALMSYFAGRRVASRHLVRAGVDALGALW